MCVYLLGDASAALQLVARGEGYGGGNGGRWAGLQAVAGADELGQSLQGVDAQLHKVTLERQRAEGGACRLREDTGQHRASLTQLLD